MKLSIIIPTYNEEEYLPKLLESIDSQDFNDYEVIIADADSTDNTVEIAKSHGAIITKGGLPGVGRNNGARIAKGEILLFLDADCILTDNYINDTVSEFVNNNVGIAITQIVPIEKGFINETTHELANIMTKAISQFKPHGAGCYGMITYKTLHEQVGGFDEKLDFGEDTDYIERVTSISKFSILNKPRLLVSTRRIEKEGLADLTVKYAKSTLKQITGRKVTLDDLGYNFNHEKKNPENIRIMYSLCGEGLGHAIRSAVVIEYLIRNGYQLVVFASGRAYKYLDQKFENIHNIGGFNTVYKDNTVKNRQTFVYNMRNVPSDLVGNLNKMYRISQIFKPDLVITDFEFYANLLSHILHIPLISIDNQHILTEGSYKTPDKYAIDKFLSESVVHAFIQSPDKILIYSYFFPRLRNRNKTHYVYPIIRDKIYNLEVEVKDHILVYQTSQSNDKLFELLKNNPEHEFIIYGFDKDEVDGNLTYRKFNEDQLYEDFKDAKFVITNGGFSFITESLQLEKPVLSIPVKKQFEQILNALYIDKLGYGKYFEILTQPKLDFFLENVETYRANIQKKYHKNSDNTVTLNIIDNTIKEVLDIK